MKLSTLFGAAVVTLGISIAPADLRAQNSGASSAPVAASTGDAGSVEPANRLFRPSDVLAAPPSRFRWGPFTLQSADFMSAYSNQPLAGNPSQVADLTRVFGQRSEILLRGSARLGLSGRWGRNVFGLHYTPSVFRQTSLDWSRVDHDMRLGFYREFGPDWRLDFDANAGTYSQYSMLMHESALEPVARLDVPITNRDLLGIIDPAQPLQLPTTEYFLTGQQLVRGNAGLTLRRRLGPRDSLFASAGYIVNRHWDSETEQGLLLQQVHSQGRSMTAGYQHSFSPRHQMGVAFGAHHMDSPYTSASQQQVQALYNWLPAPHWSVHLAAGPASRKDVNGRHPNIAAAASVARTGSSTMASFAFSRDFYFGSVPFGQQSDRLDFTWLPRPGTRKWIYSMSAGYQWISSFTSGGLEARGWLVRPALAYPINPSLHSFAQYVYFDQNWAQGISRSPINSNRHLFMFGLRWMPEGESRRP